MCNVRVGSKSVQWSYIKSQELEMMQGLFDTSRKYKYNIWGTVEKDKEKRNQIFFVKYSNLLCMCTSWTNEE